MTNNQNNIGAAGMPDGNVNRGGAPANGGNKKPSKRKSNASTKVTAASKVRRAASSAIHHMTRHVGLSVGAIVTITLALFIIGVFCFGITIVNSAMGEIEDSIVIRAFVDDSATQEDLDAFENEVKGWSEVDSVSFTTKEEAYDEYSTRSDEAAEALDALGDTNPLPASFRITLKNADDVSAISDRIKSCDEFVKIADRGELDDAVNYAESTVAPILSGIEAVRRVGIGFIALLVAISSVLITYSIRMSINMQEQEIGIMRLIGAPNDYIKRPFIVEGLFQSAIGAVAAILLLVPFKVFVLPIVKDSISFLDINIGTTTLMMIFGGIVVIGLVLGYVVSLFSIRKYLKM